MIPPITHHKVPTAFAIRTPSTHINLVSNFESLSFSEKLKSIGLIDDHFKLLFTPSEIPAVSDVGKKRFKELMDRKVHCCTDDGNINIKQSDYISGFADSLKNTGIKIETYLRGGTAAYVADLSEYFEFLIHEYLHFKQLPHDLFAKELEEYKSQKEEIPHDVDIFDQVLNEGYPATGLELFYIEFLKSLVGQGKKIRFIQRLIPEVSPLFPHPENYVLFTLGDPKEKFQTDRIIGKLRHEYLHMRDNIRIKIIGNQMCIPESAGNYWQMVIDRKLRIVRTEDWHKEDFRAGLAALQLIQDGHILIEDECTLQSIIHHALSTGDEKVFTGAISRAKLHSKDSSGFLLSVLIAYSHIATIPSEHLKILTDAIGEIPPLPSLYKYALLLTLYKDKTCSAEWDPSGFLILYRHGNRIVFPKNFSLTSTEKPFFSSLVSSWTKKASLESKSVYRVLDGELSQLERILFEIAITKPSMPLNGTLLEWIVEYLLTPDSDKLALVNILQPWFSVKPGELGWIKALLQYSFKHGLNLWNASKTKMDEKKRWTAFEEIILHIIKERPNQCYVWLDEEEIPNELREKLLIKLIENTLLSPQALIKIIGELYLWLEKKDFEEVSALLQEHRKSFKKLPETYIKFIKQFQLKSLAKEWIESFPTPERMDQTLLFFTEYGPADHPLLEIICALPGLYENKLIEALFLKGHPVFEARKASNLLALLNYAFPEAAKKEILESLAKTPLNSKESNGLQRWLQANPAVSLHMLYCLLDKNNPAFPSIALHHLLFLKTTKNALSHDMMFEPLWLNVLKFNHSHELIPFYKDREWVRSIYGRDAEVNTKVWAETLIQQKKLNKEELVAVMDILSRTKLIHSTLDQIKCFLQPFSKNVLESEEKIVSLFYFIVSRILLEITQEDKCQLHYFQKLSGLFKLAIASKLYSLNSFLMMEHIYDDLPIMNLQAGSYNPMVHLIQTLPLVDYGTEKNCNRWNEKRKKLLKKWTSDDTLRILPYATLQASCNLSLKFKLITEQYIENKVTKLEFIKEVDYLFTNDSQEFKSLELLSHEDPCLICINDLSYLLKNKNKRVRAYDAFNYLLESHLENQEESPIIIEQKNYLRIREATEDLIISGLNKLEQKKTVGLHFFHSMNLYLESLIKSDALNNLHIMDPILDAMEIESISLLERMDLQRLWHDTLNKSTEAFHVYQSQKIRSYVAHEFKSLDKTEVENYLKKRILSLKAVKKSLADQTMLTEIALILNSASLNLSIERAQTIREYLEKMLSVKVPIYLYQDDSNWINIS